MTQKKKLYSLLAILLSVTLLVTGIICALIFWLAQQSTQNFENFIVESRQQEIDSAVHSFSTDVDTLLLLMQTELNDSALTRLQLYYDSRIFNYDYLSQTTAVRNQISIIENSMPFTETLEICMLDSMRKVAWGSIATLDDVGAMRLPVLFQFTMLPRISSGLMIDRCFHDRFHTDGLPLFLFIPQIIVHDFQLFLFFAALQHDYGKALC